MEVNFSTREFYPKSQTCTMPAIDTNLCRRWLEDSSSWIRGEDTPRESWPHFDPCRMLFLLQ